MNKKIIFTRLLNEYSKKYFNDLGKALFFSLIVAISTAATAWLLDPAVKKIFLDKNLTMIYLIPLAIIVAFSSKGISLFIVRYYCINVGLNVRKDIMKNISAKILTSDMYQINEKHSAKFISHYIYDTTLITEMVSQSLLRIMKETLTLIFLLALMFYQNWKLACFALLIIPFAVIISRKLGERMGKASKTVIDNTGNLSKYLSEMLGSIELIKIFQKEKYEIERSSKTISELINKTKKMETVAIRATPIMEVVTGFIIAGFILYSGYLVVNNEIQINNFLSFLAAMMLSYQPVRALAQIHIGLNSGLAAASRLFEVLDQKSHIIDKKTDPSLIISNGSIEFNNVNFNYPGQNNNALSNIDMKINGGETIAFVGHSGAGKSTIFNLLPRFYDIQSGEITIDNQSISNVSLNTLRKNISLVSQDVFLFDDTVYSNILYAKLDASEEEIIKASQSAAAEEFIKQLNNGYKTVVGEKGVKLSGGQKQRISIARALLKNAPIILLDEATSSLDAESEEKVQNAVMNLTKNKTTLVIAHRLSTIIRANKIIVMNQGKIVDIGTHNDLLKNSTIYKNLYSKQIS